MDLDTMLAGASPHVVEPGVDVSRILNKMAAAPSRRRPRLLRIGLALGGVAAVAGATTAAVITYTNGNVPDSLVDATYSWTTTGGVACHISVEFGPRPATDPRYSPDQMAALSAAQTWAKSFNVASIDRGEAEERWLDHMEAISVGHPTRAELVAKFQGQRLETNAVLYEVTMQADHALRDHGFDPASLNSGAGIACGDQ